MTFTAPQTPAKQLEFRIANVVRAASHRAPRSQQVRLGPSEIGDPCVRKLSYKLLEVEKLNTFSDPWPSISGTAIHAWLAEAFGTADVGDYLIEHKVTARPGLSGTVDLYEVATGTVIDHKCVGQTSMKKAKLDGPTHQQKVQINIYAYGLKQQGYDVKKVALAFYPLGGMLTGLHCWIDDYDEQIALDAMNRQDDILSLLNVIDVEANPENWSLIPIAPSRNCNFCNWHDPSATDVSKGCAGLV